MQCARMIIQLLGIIENVFIGHLGGALVALIPLLYFAGGKLAQWKTLPWYTLVAGAFGMIVIAAISYIIPRAGVAVSVTAVVAGQLLVGTILDHYGLLGAVEKPF